MVQLQALFKTSNNCVLTVTGNRINPKNIIVLRIVLPSTRYCVTYCYTYIHLLIGLSAPFSDSKKHIYEPPATPNGLGGIQSVLRHRKPL